MKKGFKIGLGIFVIHFVINIIYFLMDKIFWWVKDDYILILSPATIACVGGDCGTGFLILLMIISGLIISILLTGIILLFSRKQTA